MQRTRQHRRWRGRPSGSGRRTCRSPKAESRRRLSLVAAGWPQRASPRSRCGFELQPMHASTATRPGEYLQGVDAKATGPKSGRSADRRGRSGCAGRCPTPPLPCKLPAGALHYGEQRRLIRSASTANGDDVTGRGRHGRRSPLDRVTTSSYSSACSTATSAGSGNVARHEFSGDDGHPTFQVSGRKHPVWTDPTGTYDQDSSGEAGRG